MYIILSCTCDNVNTSNGGDIKFNYAELESLSEYKPFSDDIDIDARLTTINESNVALNMNEDHLSDEDEYIVEKVIKKKFNSRLGQYEFLVKWKDYSAKYNTWELASNIPDEAITSFELSQHTHAHHSTQDTGCRGLRDRSTIKVKYNADFIRND